jgi:hypothetical protein
MNEIGAMYYPIAIHDPLCPDNLNARKSGTSHKFKARLVARL